MTDYFALLDTPRLPWVDADAVKARFLRKSSEAHPDRVHNEAAEEKQQASRLFAELNAACQNLCDHKERLLHLLELETGSRPGNVQRIPPGTMDLFMEVGQLCREVDAFLAERSKITSPMVKVRWFEKGLEWTDRLNGLQGRVNAMRDALCEELRSMNSAWESAPPPGSPERLKALPLERLEQVYRMFSYVARWTEQLQERQVQMAV